MGTECSNCKSVCAFVVTNNMDGTGNEDSPDIMFIGDAPDGTDDTEGKPFKGGSGLWFKKNILRPLSISESDAYFTNAVHCRPTKKGYGGSRVNSNPDRRIIINCREKLELEIKRVKPKVLVLLGNASLCSVTFSDKVQGIMRWRGRSMWNREFDCWMIGSYSPFAVMVDSNRGLRFKYNQMISDIQKAQELAVRPKVSSKLPGWRLLDDESAVLKYMKESSVDDKIAVDLETDGLDCRNDILGISLTYSDGKKYYPVYIPWSVIEDSERCTEELSRILLSKKIVKIGHNIDFDRKFLHFHGFDMDGTLYDTMSMAQLLDENFSIGLKERTWTELGFGGYEIPLEKYKWENKFNKNSSYAEIPVDVMAPYAAYDTYATYRLYEKYIPMLKSEKLYPLFTQITTPVRSVMTEASIAGIYVDMEQAEILDARMTKAKDKLEKMIYAYAGVKFNFNSTQQLSRLLFEELHAPNMGKSKSNNWKCDKAVLKALAGKTVNKKYVKIAQAVLKYKYLDKLQGTYIGQAREYVWEDNRVHSSYNLCGTVTGRTSNSKPCTHNIPTDRLIRSLYRSTPGNVLIEADIKSAEMRAIAISSGDEVLLNIFKMGVDIHEQTFREMFHKSQDYIPSDDERRIAKSINFGLIYGITAVGLARRLGITPDEAQSYIDIYFKRFAGVARWLADTVDFAKRNGYVASLFMRRRRLPEIKSDDKFEVYRASRQAMNSPIQGLASDWTYIGMVRVAKQIKKRRLTAKIIHTVHDCILVDTPPSEVDEVKRIIQWAFSTQIKALPIEMAVDIETGEKWGEHKESKLEPILKELAA
jgi:DNA polymerase-1